ncbi:hypothetical protein [Acetivibrio cellulolyticus]
MNRRRCKDLKRNVKVYHVNLPKSIRLQSPSEKTSNESTTYNSASTRFSYKDILKPTNSKQTTTWVSTGR